MGNVMASGEQVSVDVSSGGEFEYRPMVWLTEAEYPHGLVAVMVSVYVSNAVVLGTSPLVRTVIATGSTINHTG